MKMANHRLSEESHIPHKSIDSKHPSHGKGSPSAMFAYGILPPNVAQISSHCTVSLSHPVNLHSITEPYLHVVPETKACSLDKNYFSVADH